MYVGSQEQAHPPNDTRTGNLIYKGTETVKLTRETHQAARQILPF